MLTDDLIIQLVQWGEIKLAEAMNPTLFPREKAWDRMHRKSFEKLISGIKPFCNEEKRVQRPSSSCAGELGRAGMSRH